VTLFDFELAEQMNVNYKIAKKSFNMFPRISDKTWSSLLIFFGMYFGLLFGFQIISNFGKLDPPPELRGKQRPPK